MIGVPKPIGERSKGLLEWIQHCPCAICWRMGKAQRYPTEAAHTPRVRIHGDRNNVVPLCGSPWGHHAEEEKLQPEAFGAKYGVDMAELAREYTRRFDIVEAA